MENDVEQEGSGVLALGLECAGVVLVEEVDNIISASHKQLAAKERAHGDNAAEHQVGKVLGLVLARIQILVHDIGQVKGTGNEADAHQQEQNGEGGLEHAKEISDNVSIAAIASEGVARACTLGPGLAKD